MENNIIDKLMNANSVFDSRYMDVKQLYVYYFSKLPSVNFITGIDGEKAFNNFLVLFKDEIINIHQSRSYERKRNKYDFDTSILVLKNNVIMEFGTHYCEIMNDGLNSVMIDELTNAINKFKMRQRRQPLEINLVVRDCGDLELKPVEVKRTRLDLNLFYEDDFIAVDELIRKRLGQKKDKGIVLLHGLPGTGKTSYLRYLIGKIKKRILFLSPGNANNLTSPEFIELLIENQNSVVIIEDAENIMLDRTVNNGSTVSGLLNISDGLLADFLNVQLICTFNSPVALIDKALMRKGRLIARYEFGKLSVAKARQLSKQFGFDTMINAPMTLAEIANQHQIDNNKTRIEVLGFRREMLEN